MSNSPCEELDAYLADWLPENQRATFETHLADCCDCRSQVRLQQRLDRLLALGHERIEPVPPALLDSIEGRIHTLQHRRAIQLAWAVPAAAMIVLLSGVWLVQQLVRSPLDPKPLAEQRGASEGSEEDAVSPSNPASDADRLVRVTPSDPTSAILVSVETEARNVSFVWVYPTLNQVHPRNGADTN